MWACLLSLPFVLPPGAGQAAPSTIAGAESPDMVVERVEIATSGGDRALPLVGRLLRPADGRRGPAVVALHGCGGLWTASGDLGAREAAWARLFVARGWSVLFPDSFGSRSAGSQCKQVHRVATASGARRDDARAAFDWLATRPWVDPQRIALLGWSNGATTTLGAVHPGREPKSGDFRAAVAFYPGCSRLAARGGWSSRLDLLILIGEADDWTPAAPCRRLAEADPDRVSIVTYPGAWHDFDHPSAPVRVRTGLAFTADGAGTAHVGSDPAARADALARVPAWLDLHFR